MDGLYFRVSSNQQTTENQFEDLVAVAEHSDPNRDWLGIRRMLAQVVVVEDRSPEQDGSRIAYRVNPEVAASLAGLSIYVEQG